MATKTQKTAKNDEFEKLLDQIEKRFDNSLKEAPDQEFDEDVTHKTVLKGDFLKKCIDVKFVKEHSCIITLVPRNKQWWITTRVDLGLEPQKHLDAKTLTIAHVEGEYNGKPYSKDVIYAVDL